MSDVTSVINNFSTANEGFLTTLSGSILAGAVTVPLTSVSGLSNGTIFVGIIEPGLTKQQTFTGTVDTSGAQITGVVWTRGTNADHTAGVTIVDYVSGTGHNMMTKGISVGHNQNGTHKTNLPLTSPKITTAILDANANEVIRTPATASAVNDITITNAATGTFPSVGASGDDTNIDMLLLGKGTGSARHAGPYDGWVAANETLTYASATTFTCSAALAGTLGIGDRLKLTQTTVKYFVVVGVSGTTVTVTGGGDYTLASAAITLPFYSHETSPTGYPGWFAYVGAMQANGGTAPTYTATDVGKFNVNGRNCTVDVLKSNSSGGTVGAGAVALQYTLPITANVATTAGATVPCGAGIIFNNATGLSIIALVDSVGSGANLIFKQPTTANMTNADQNNAVRQLHFSATYQI